MEGEKSTKIELGCLEELDLAHVYLGVVSRWGYKPKALAVITHVLKWVNALCRFLDFTTNDLRDELSDELLQCAVLCLPLHDVGHLLANCANLRAGGICGLLDLVLSSLGEGNTEQSKQVLVGGFDDNVGLDESLPLADQRAKLIGGEVKAMEIGQDVPALHFVGS